MQRRTNKHVEGWNSKLTELKDAQLDAAILPPQKKKKHIVTDQRLAVIKQEYGSGCRAVLSFLHAAGHLLRLE